MNWKCKIFGHKWELWGFLGMPRFGNYYTERRYCQRNDAFQDRTVAKLNAANPLP